MLSSQNFTFALWSFPTVDHLGNSESDQNAWLFSCKLFCCVIGSKVDGPGIQKLKNIMKLRFYCVHYHVSPVDDDSLHRAEESWVETFHHTVRLEAFANAVHQTLTFEEVEKENHS